jgi:hypothetical protein
MCPELIIIWLKDKMQERKQQDQNNVYSVFVGMVRIKHGTRYGVEFQKAGQT